MAVLILELQSLLKSVFQTAGFGFVNADLHLRTWKGLVAGAGDLLNLCHCQLLLWASWQ